MIIVDSMHKSNFHSVTCTMIYYDTHYINMEHVNFPKQTWNRYQIKHHDSQDKFKEDDNQETCDSIKMTLLTTANAA